MEFTFAGESDGFAWPQRDGLKWPHLALPASWMTSPLGFRASVDFAEGLRRTIDAYEPSARACAEG